MYIFFYFLDYDVTFCMSSSNVFIKKGDESAEWKETNLNEFFDFMDREIDSLSEIKVLYRNSWKGRIFREFFN